MTHHPSLPTLLWGAAHATLTLTLLCPAATQEQPAAIPANTDIHDLTGPQREALFAQFLRRTKSPIAYLTDKVKVHDLVLLGEIHQVRETCELVANALGPLYRDAGLRCLATEFLRSRNTEAANALVTAKEWDPEQANELMRDGPWPTWGFKEYRDILAAVHEVNARRKPGHEPLRVCGLDSEWKQYDMWFEIKDRRQRFDILLRREKNMERAIVDGPLAAKRKTLIHVGFAHSVTNDGIRLGTVLRKRYGKQVFQVAMHHILGKDKAAWSLPLMLERFAGRALKGPVGFDVVNSPFDRLRDRETYLWRRRPKARFAEFAEGYIVLRSVQKLQQTRWIEGFIKPRTFVEANAIAVRMGWVKKGECKDAASLDAKLAAKFGT